MNKGGGTSEKRLGQGGPHHLQQGGYLSEVSVPPVRGHLYAKEALGAVGGSGYSHAAGLILRRNPGFQLPGSTW